MNGLRDSNGLQWTPKNFYRAGRSWTFYRFKALSKTLSKDLTVMNLTYNWHSWCLPEDDFYSNTLLQGFNGPYSNRTEHSEWEQIFFMTIGPWNPDKSNKPFRTYHQVLIFTD